MTFRDRWLPILLAGTFIVCMCAVVAATGCDEILFPETCAILCGTWMQPRQAWNVDRPRMMLLMGSGAIVGVLLNLYVPLPIWWRAIMGYAFAAVMMCSLGADMTPMLSAVILPVLLGTTSWIYPLAVIALVGLIEVGQVLLEKYGLREPIDYHVFRRTPRQMLVSWTGRLGVFALLSAPAYFTGNPFFAVPPLLVAYTELTRPDMTLRLRPFRSWATLALAGCIGQLGRCAVQLGGVPLPLAVAACFVGLVFVWDSLHVWMPPAGAAMLLAFLVPFAGPFTYAIEVAVGAAIWVAAATLLFPGIRPPRLEAFLRHEDFREDDASAEAE